MAWAEQTLAELSQGQAGATDWRPWQEYIAGLLTAAGGVDGAPQAPVARLSVPPGIPCSCPGMNASASRIFRSSILLSTSSRTAKRQPEAHREWRFRHYLNEMTAAETLGSILWMTPEMPWEFQYNLARHLWDEVRHSQLGQDMIRRLGYEPKDIWQVVQIYNVMMTLPAVEQYALLTTVIEPNGMPEKRVNIEHFERIHDEISAQAITYDWSDENNHVRWGKKWTPVLLETYGYSETPDEIAARTEKWLL